MGEFRMPSLGADMEAGTLLQWFVSPGSTVKKGDVVALVATDKADIEVEVFQSGTVEELLVEAGTKVPVGTVLATLSGPERGAAAVEAPSPAAAAPTRVEARPMPLPWRRAARVARASSPLLRRRARALGVDLGAIEGTGPGGAITRRDLERAASRPEPAPRRPVSPRARKVAAELGIDLSAVTGTGPAGAITEADVLRRRPPAEATAPAPEDGDRRAAMRRAIGDLMSRSKREVPHYYLTHTIDVTPAVRWLEKGNLARPVDRRILPAALLLRAVAVAATKVPEMNGHWIDGGFRPSEAVHLGVVVSLRGGGLVAPVITGAHEMHLEDLMVALRELGTRARSGRLRSSEMSVPTITVTNLGDQGVDSVTGVIYPPQVALVGFGRISERPWTEGGMLGIRSVVTATLSADHRVSDGMRGARFLSIIARLLRSPEDLL